MTIRQQPYILPNSVHVVDYGDTICAVKIVKSEKDLEKYFTHIFMNGCCIVIFNKKQYQVDPKHFNYGVPNSLGEMVVYFLAYAYQPEEGMIVTKRKERRKHG